MEAVCKYCNEVEHKQLAPALKCVDCGAYVHLKCLKREGTPGDFAGDVFFDFTCLECSKCGEECFIRNKISWVNVILLTISHLNIQSHGISHHGFFHYKTHIASFIDRNWQMLFGSQVKQKKNWMGTLAGTLSVYNGLIFRSGSIVLGEAGWWKLQHLFTPALASYIIVEATKDKKSRPKGHGLDRTLFYSKIRALGYIDYVLVENDIPIAVEPVAKRARLQSENHSDTGASVHSESSRHAPSDTEPRSEPDITILDSSYACLTSKNSYSDVDSFFTSYEFDNHSIEVCKVYTGRPPTRWTDDLNKTAGNRWIQRAQDRAEWHRLGEAHVQQWTAKEVPERHESSSEHTLLPSAHHSDSDSRGSHATPTPTPTPAHAHTHAEHTDHVDVVVRRESLFSTQLNSVDAPWFEKEERAPRGVVELTEYEEIQLLKQVEGLAARVRHADQRAYLGRLRAKLALRRLKRHKHLPIFDLDKSVKVLGGYVTDDHKTEANVERVLDRFQRSYLMDSLTGTISQPSYGTVLLSHISATPLRSAHSGSVLKPYIRRDRHCKPLWLRFTDELLRRTHRHIKDYEPPPHASIDYSYVRPQHIPAINNLCAQFFWPGIDLTEALQQPELSCVVTYRRLVVGCAFLVADAGQDAYLSFLLTRPRWRRAGLARFMLYHLLQTCTGKDVTLHVSPTNPAIFLYQKFGFKVEELVQDFYEKYYEIDHKGCRHALFLRLVR